MESEQGDSAIEGSKPPLIGDDDLALSEFVENMGLHYESYGVPRIGGRILGLLLVTPRPISSEEMAEALQVSRSSISTNLRTLLLTGLVEKVSLPGERVDFFEFAEDAWENALQLRLADILPLKELAEEGLEGLEPGSPGQQRLLEMMEWAELVNEFSQQLTLAWQSRRESTS